MTRKASSRPARKRASSCSSERSRRSGVGSGRRRGTAVATAHWNVGAAPTYRFSHLPIRSRGGPRCGGMRTMLLPLVFLALAAPARAAGPEIGVADDRVLMAGGAEADRVVAEWRANGVEVVRIFAQSTRVERWGWGELDASVARVRGAGMGPILTVVGPRVRPSKEKLAAFAGEVAARYGAVVDRYIVWNEPNLAAWLMPQATCSHGRCSPVAPHLYRGLVRAARPAIQAADPGAQVLIGAMSSRGQDLRKTDVTERPMVFLRALGCVDARWHRLRTGYCKDFRPATADGFAFHPHGTLNSPDRPYPNRDDVNLASLGRLEGALDRLQRGGRLLATTPRLGLYLDEYGYQTRPPDRTARVSLATQDRWLQRAAYRAWRDPRVKLLVPYQWLDQPRGPPPRPGRRPGGGVGGRFPGAGGPAGAAVLGLAVGAALRQRQAEARARALRHADAARLCPVAPVGAGAAGRSADGAGRAAA